MLFRPTFASLVAFVLLSANVQALLGPDTVLQGATNPLRTLDQDRAKGQVNTTAGVRGSNEFKDQTGAHNTKPSEHANTDSRPATGGSFSTAASNQTTTGAVHGIVKNADHRSGTKFADCLAAAFGGDKERIVWPESQFYQDARMGEKVQFEQFPVAIAYAENEKEVAELVKCGVAAKVNMNPRTGGHHFEAFSAQNDSLTIDINHMNSVEVDETMRTARVGGGIRFGALYTALDKHNTTWTGGICPTVGLSGFLGSGGFNMVQRTHGLGVENVAAARVVLASGEIVNASASQNPDLFWAIRGGGGGSYGIVTEWTLRTLDLDQEHNTMVTINYTDPNPDQFAIAKRYFEWAPGAPKHFMSQINIRPKTVDILGWYRGHPANLQKRLDQSGLLKFGKPTVTIAGNCHQLNARLFGYSGINVCNDQIVGAARAYMNVQADPFTKVGTFPQWRDNENSTLQNHALPAAGEWQRFLRLSKSFFVQKNNKMSDATLKSAIDLINEADPEGAPWGEWHSWGLMNPSRPSDTAFAWHEEAWAHLEYAIHGSDDPKVDKQRRAWLEKVEKTIRPKVGPASYSGYMDMDISTDPLTSYYGKNVCKLVKIKAKYDPNEAFHNPFSMPAKPPANMKC